MFRSPLVNRLVRLVLHKDIESVFRGMAVLASGSALAKLIGVLSLPVLTRLYTPSDFGIMAVFLALVQIVTPILTLRYGLAIPLARRDATAMNVVAVSVLTLVGLGAIMALILWANATPVLRLFSMEELAAWWWLIVAGCMGGAIYEILSYWATRRRSYKIVARTNVTQRLWGSLIKIGLGLISFGAGGLMIGQVVALSGGTLAMTQAFWTDFKRSIKHVRPSRMRRIALLYGSFPIYRVPSQFLLQFAKQLPLIGFAYLYTPAITGALSVAMSTLLLPLGLIGTAMGNALYAEAAKLGLKNRHKIYKMAKQTQLRLFFASVGPALVLFVFGPQLFALILGQEWEMAGHFASILAAVTVFQFTSAPLMQLLNIFRDQSLFLLINVFRSIAVCAVFLVAAKLNFSEDRALSIYSIVMVIFYISISYVVMARLKDGDAN